MAGPGPRPAPLRPWRSALAAALAAACGAARDIPRSDRYPLRVTDVLPVVAVTYSPGPHLERFLASLSLATERPVRVLLADNGSTDGTPQAAVERYPNVRLLPTGGNLGYGTAVNFTVSQLDRLGEDWLDDWVIVANPDVQWGPGSIDALLGPPSAGPAPALWVR
ncbi:hypothetical protein NIIDMKKI_59000 [Mycobacterium kansasii]|uniref:Glycosyltransferase 2-like domain-containing protein n=1 Tax=Mycobacterium kansasii TaxID=1768 RepID=A0A7G1IJR2_MYCKA|nr:hypothetical protein NIIDMKKI_59000 [Mycobacterium kansasii]